MPVIISRCNNVYGPHQYVEKCIPKFATRLLLGMKCCVHDDGSSERDFLYVEDVANAFDCLLHHGKPGRFYNIGAEVGQTVIEVARALIRIIKKDQLKDGQLSVDDFIEYTPGRVHDDKRYKIDSSMIKELGWSPKVSFQDGLERTVEWYKNHMDYWPNSEKSLKPHPD